MAEGRGSRSFEHVAKPYRYGGSTTRNGAELAGFYGYADQALRARSWKLLRQLVGKNALPWVVGGDYNEILSIDEKVCKVYRADNLLDMFRMALMDCSLSDFSFESDKYTWTNNREAPNTVRCRLDRVCTSFSWFTFFSDSFVEHLRYPGSDHVPILLHWKRPAKVLGGARRWPWRFEAQWIRHSECEEIIKEALDSQTANDNFERLFNGIEACQLGLRQMVRIGEEGIIRA